MFAKNNKHIYGAPKYMHCFVTELNSITLIHIFLMDFIFQHNFYKKKLI